MWLTLVPITFSYAGEEYENEVITYELISGKMLWCHLKKVQNCLFNSMKFKYFLFWDFI